MNLHQQDKLKGWLHSFKKKTSRLSTRITASLGIISLTRDEEFERHHETFRTIEKTIRKFVKNLKAYMEHMERFLVSLQQTSNNLIDFYCDKQYVDELRTTNKNLANQYGDFKKRLDENVVTVASQLLQRFVIPHQLISKRNAKLLDLFNKSKQIDSCRDEYVIAQENYEKINKQLIEQLPIFNQIALHIFKECIVGLLENRRNLTHSYATQLTSLLNTPLLMNYAANEAIGDIRELEEEPSRMAIGIVPPMEPPIEIIQNQSLNRQMSTSTPLPDISLNNRSNAGSNCGSVIIEDQIDSASPVKTTPRRKKHRFPTYIALWPFEATDRNQLNIQAKQELKVLKACDESGNNEWSLVRDRWNRVGYVPSSYIKKKNL